MAVSSGPTPDPSFYSRPATELARELIGCSLLRDGVGGVVVETEAYDQSEAAAHSYAGPRGRAKTLFGPPGTAYIYRSYGIHRLFNVVAGAEGHGAAVLIRALEPRWGLSTMRARRGVASLPALCSGPGKVGEALGIELSEDSISLGAAGSPYVLRLPEVAGPARVVAGPRVGISKATELPWRFCLAGSEHVSRPRP